MQILVGDGSGKNLIKFCKEHQVGRMFSANWPKLYEGEPWGFDNRAFIYWSKAGRPFPNPGGEFNETDFLKRLDKALLNPLPYIAVTPDIVAGGMKSLELSDGWIKRLPSDFPWYLAVQDGMDVASVIESLANYQGIFLGGTDNYKRYAGYWCKIAHHFGKKFHYGRAGTLNKVAHAIRIDADSLDSSFPLWTKDRLFSFIQSFSQMHFDGLVTLHEHPTGGCGFLC